MMGSDERESQCLVNDTNSAASLICNRSTWYCRSTVKPTNCIPQNGSIVAFASLWGGCVMKTMIALILVSMGISACTKASADVDPKAIEQKYGMSGGYVDQIDTESGKVQATIIPTMLDDGRRVQLIIPHEAIGDHQV